MILLITSSTHAEGCAGALQKATGKKVLIAHTLRQALVMIRRQEYSVVVIDEGLLETSASAAEVLWTRLRGAIPVVLNFSVNSVPRIAREVIAAIQRVGQERLAARSAAENEVRSELKDELTGILLASEMALTSKERESAQQHMRSVLELAQKIRDRLHG